mgnify:CR=1 FL=1
MFLNVANNINGALVMEKILNKIESPDDLKKLNKLPLADASCINHSALRSSSPKLRKPYGWAGMSAIYLLTQTFES